MKLNAANQIYILPHDITSCVDDGDYIGVRCVVGVVMLCDGAIEMMLQFTVIIATVAPSTATKTGLRESLLTYGFLDYVHGEMFVFDHGPNKAFLLLLLLRRSASTRRS